MSKIVELEKQLMQRNKELDVVRVSTTTTARQPPRWARQGMRSGSRLVERAHFRGMCSCSIFMGASGTISEVILT
jgi:hypothetical protein